MIQKINLVILGSTGSIGTQALQVVDKHPDRFRVVGLAAHHEVNDLMEQIDRYQPLAVAVADEAAYRELKTVAGSRVRVMGGLSGLMELAALPEAETVLVAVSGAVGIRPTLAAIESGKRVALANKETLVAAGDLVMARVRDNGATLLPVDSEHSAIFQCLAGEQKHVKNIWLTASGGPFREYSSEQLQKVTVKMALAHPTWIMGPKITIDSATLMNKGLEVIEAHHLFDIEYNQISVIVHRESIIHSMVEFVDGSYLAHLGSHDMRIPIQYALTYPSRWESPASSLDFASVAGLHFENPDVKRFPCLELAYRAGLNGGTMPAVMNAANEVAVEAFRIDRLKFMDIPDLVARVMDLHQAMRGVGLEAILEADSWARQTCRELVKEYK